MEVIHLEPLPNISQSCSIFHTHVSSVTMDVDNEEPPASEEEVFEPQDPRPIKRLSDDVINQIAAAEVGSYFT